jgi:nucleotidyltransferase/DNA polymerase involved in DNA repair
MPVGILGNHGACIIAKSYEMKAYGIATGTPIWDAVKICPDGIYVKRDFAWYESISRRMLEFLKLESPRVEYYSVDEMFFLTERASEEFAKDLQQRVLQRIGIPVSIGIAPTKILAKLATGLRKPFGVCVIPDDVSCVELLAGLPVTKITGIAKKSAQKLLKYGITTCDQFANTDRAMIRKILTKKGEDLWWELRGESILQVQPQRPRHKFVARGGSLGRATGDRDRLRAFVVRNVERLIEAPGAIIRTCVLGR